MPAPKHDPPPEINPFESPKSEPRPELPPLGREEPQQESIWPLVKLMSPVWFPGIFYFLHRFFGLPEEIHFSGEINGSLYYMTIDSAPLILTIAVTVIGLCGWCTMRWLRNRNSRVTAACAIFFGICSIPAVVLITAVCIQAWS